MIKINLEFKKGILFIRVKGSLISNSNKEFRNEVFPVVLKHEFKYIVLNFEELTQLDECGIETLIDLNNIVVSCKGQATICNITNNEIKDKIYNSEISNCYYQTNTELTAIGVFKI